MSATLNEINDRLKAIEAKLDGTHRSSEFKLNLSGKGSKGFDSKLYKSICALLPDDQKWVADNLCIVWLTGSYLYGTNTETSDLDYVGVALPSIDVKLGIQNWNESDLSSKKSNENRRNNSDDVDCKIYSFDKFMKLLMENNPNVTELVFAPEKNIIICNDIGREIMALAPHIPNRRIIHATAGYAYQQIKLLKTKKENMTGRKELAEKYGFDTKFASHAFRLLYEGIEFMTTGELVLPLNQRQRLIEIKNGYFSDVDECLEAANELIQEFEKAKLTNILRDKPNYKLFNDFIVGTYKKVYGINS